MFYYTIHGKAASKLRAIHLAIVCHASDVKEYGYAAILKPFIADMEALYSGVSLAGNDGMYPKLYATLEHIVGDNLAANAILGMIQSFSGGHCCRFCYISKNEIPESTHCRDRLRRSAIGNHLDVEMVLDNADLTSSHGVKQPCALDELSYFSGVDSTVPDVM
jgi:hypothetical protein